MDYQDRYMKRYRPQQYVSFEAYQRIRSKEIDACGQSQLPETTTQLKQVSRRRRALTAILSMFTR